MSLRGLEMSDKQTNGARAPHLLVDRFALHPSSSLVPRPRPRSFRFPLSAFRFPLSAFRFSLFAFRFSLSAFRFSFRSCSISISNCPLRISLSRRCPVGGNAVRLSRTTQNSHFIITIFTARRLRRSNEHPTSVVNPPRRSKTSNIFPQITQITQIFADERRRPLQPLESVNLR